jgi:hypothetical protein
MEVHDYNADGRWSAEEIIARYLRLASKMGISPRDLSPLRHSEPDQNWVYPVMDKVIEGIEAGDIACIHIGIEVIEEDSKFPFGKILKSNTARSLRRALLSDEQKQRIRRRVFAMLRAGHVPHEYREYAKLARKIGFDVGEIPDVDLSDPRVARFIAYFEMVGKVDKS